MVSGRETVRREEDGITNFLLFSLCVFHLLLPPPSLSPPLSLSLSLSLPPSLSPPLSLIHTQNFLILTVHSNHLLSVVYHKNKQGSDTIFKLILSATKSTKLSNEYHYPMKSLMLTLECIHHSDLTCTCMHMQVTSRQNQHAGCGMLTASINTCLKCIIL